MWLKLFRKIDRKILVFQNNYQYFEKYMVCSTSTKSSKMNKISYSNSCPNLIQQSR